MQSSSIESASVLLPAEAWAIDAGASTVGFQVRHFHFSTVEGDFSRFAGDLGPWGAAGSVDVASVDTGSEIRDARLRSEFFDAESFPLITFETDGPICATTPGRLMIRGVARPLTFQVERDNDGEVLRLLARAKISRKAYGLDWAALREAGGLVVSDRVDIRIELVARPV